MSDCERDVESMEDRADSTDKRVVRYDGGRPATGQCGQTRQAGIVALGEPHPSQREQAVFRGKETLRKISR
jgi:hypothetical protein